MKSFNFAILMFVLFSGCTKHDVSVNNNPSFDYSIDQSRDCFCPQGGTPVRLFIVADTIADAVWITTYEHLTFVEWQRFRSIKGLYSEISYWDSSSVFQVNATYDSVYHYPSVVSITPKPVVVNDTLVSIITDANVSYKTWNYTKHK